MSLLRFVIGLIFGNSVNIGSNLLKPTALNGSVIEYPVVEQHFYFINLCIS